MENDGILRHLPDVKTFRRSKRRFRILSTTAVQIDHRCRTGSQCHVQRRLFCFPVFRIRLGQQCRYRQQRFNSGPGQRYPRQRQLCQQRSGSSSLSVGPQQPESLLCDQFRNPFTSAPPSPSCLSSKRSAARRTGRRSGFRARGSGDPIDVQRRYRSSQVLCR